MRILHSGKTIFDGLRSGFARIIEQTSVFKQKSSGHLWRKFRFNISANAGITFAVVATPALGLVGAGIDFSRAHLTRSLLQSACDSAVLAAVTSQDQTAAGLSRTVNAYLDSTLPSWLQGTYPDPAPVNRDNRVELNLYAKSPTTILKVVERRDLPVHVKCAAVNGTGKIELALVLDNTGSMYGQKIRSLKSAATTLISTLKPVGENDPAMVKIGIVPFSESVRLPADMRVPGIFKTAQQSSNTRQCRKWRRRCGSFNGWGYCRSLYQSCQRSMTGTEVPGIPSNWAGCVIPREAPYHLDDTEPDPANPATLFKAVNTIQYQTTGNENRDASCNIEPLLGLSSDRDTILDKIGEMQATGYTYIPIGMVWGWRVLSSSEPFTEGVIENNTDTNKVMVVMTDGANTIKRYEQRSVFNPDTRTAELCTKVKQAGITVYTITFGNLHRSTRNMMKACASDENHYFHAPTPPALAQVFGQIGVALSKVRLVK